MKREPDDAGDRSPILAAEVSPHFERLGIILKPNELLNERLGVLNPASARLRDGTLQLYPRMVAPGNISSIGSFRVEEHPDGTLVAGHCSFVLEPAVPYELRDQPGGYGCEDPRVTFIPVIDRYVMAYVAFGPRRFSPSRYTRRREFRPLHSSIGPRFKPRCKKVSWPALNWQHCRRIYGKVSRLATCPWMP